MLKKIKVSDARMGMYIHEFCGVWIKHPFWKKTLKITKQKDLDMLLSSELDEIWIDTSKGLDLMELMKDCVETPVDLTSNEVEKKPEEIKPVVRKAEGKVPIQEELVAAKKIHIMAKEEVISMFGDARMGKAIETDAAVFLVNDIIQSTTRNANALLNLVQLKNSDEYTYLHSVAVCVLMVALGRRLGLEGDLLEQVGVAGLFHDIGKMQIPNEILNKPEKLTDEEFYIVKTHPQKGEELLRASTGISELVLDVCLHHHERIDGCGYPDQLSEKALSTYVRMAAVCDVYDAVTSDRCYKSGWEPAEAIHKMATWGEGQFDKTIFHAFVKTVGIYPNGTLLKLKSWRLGIVIEQSTKSLTTPIVHVFFSIHSDTFISPDIVDLSKSTDSVVSVEDPLKWKLDIDKIKSAYNGADL